MKIRIFIETLTKAPGIQKMNEAAWLISCVLPDGKEATRDGFVSIPDASTAKTVLLALIAALDRFTKPCEIELFIDEKSVRSTLVNGWLAKWQENGWKKPKGEIRNLEEWQKLSELLKIHTVIYATEENLSHEYKGWMHREMQRRKNEWESQKMMTASTK